MNIFYFSKFMISNSNHFLKNEPLLFIRYYFKKFNYCTTSAANVLHNKSLSDNLTSNKTDDTVQSEIRSTVQEDMPIQMSNPYERDRKVCLLCKYDIKLDYKNPKLLSQFVSPFTGQVYERHITALCAKQQRILKQEIQKSAAAGLMPVMMKSVEFLKDPPICDPSNPIRPHKW